MILTKTYSSTTPISVTISPNTVPDTVSSTCGIDGFTFCGIRKIEFFDSTGNLIHFPYHGVTVIPSNTNSILQLGPTTTFEDVGFYVITATISLTSDPTVKYSENITVTITSDYCLIPIGGLNLLNTNIRATQSSFFYTAAYNSNAN